jgi:hypothetical protein
MIVVPIVGTFWIGLHILLAQKHIDARHSAQAGHTRPSSSQLGLDHLRFRAPKVTTETEEWEGMSCTRRSFLKGHSVHVWLGRVPDSAQPELKVTGGGQVPILTPILVNTVAVFGGIATVRLAHRRRRRPGPGILLWPGCDVG